MPLYVYKCIKCNHVFTTLQKLGAEDPCCPECGSVKTEKQVTAPSGFDFKGGGFYQTDYRHK